MSDYYNQNAFSFVSGTLNVDMQSIYTKFIPLLPKDACILDAGCGSGRDSQYFKECGYSVSAFDASIEMTKYAAEVIGQPVQLMRFQDMTYTNKFDAIWACASLLHVPESDLPDVYTRLMQAMKDNAVLYCSFKYGSDERESNGRRFTNRNESLFKRDISSFSNLMIIDQWLSGDQREGRESEQWFNALVRKVVATSGSK